MARKIISVASAFRFSLTIAVAGILPSIAVGQQRGYEARLGDVTPARPVRKAGETTRTIKTPVFSDNPKPGERLTVLKPNCPTAPDYLALRDYLKAVNAKDEVGLKAMTDAKTIVSVPDGVGVLVIKYRDFRPHEAPQVYTSASSAVRSFQGSSSSEPDPDFPNAVEVRFTDGPLKDQVRLLPDGWVGEMVDRSVIVPKPKTAPKAKPVDPEARAASLLQAAEALEKAGKISVARTYYDRILREFPASAAAQQVEARIKAMGSER